MLHTSLLGNPHRARVMIVDTGIVAMVDAAEHQVGLTGNELVESQFDAVHGRTVARPHLHVAHVVPAFQAQGRCRRESTRETGPGTFGGNDKEVAPVFEKAHESFDTIGMIAIIIRN